MIQPGTANGEPGTANPYRMGAGSVRLEGVGKRYGDTWAVRGVDLRVEPGEFFTLLGPSGCGKTTLLRSIAGFVTPDEGTIYLDDGPVRAVPPWKRDVGLVFQNYALWPHMTVFENVAFGLRQRRVAAAERLERVRRALALVNLGGLEGRRPSQLSGGQQQRVALARTLVVEPRVLLLDEPLSNLDAKLRAQMRIELLKLQQDLGITALYVTHDQEEALALSSRIAVMSEGRVVQVGTPRAIYENPADAFVAGFVGTANLWTATVVERRGDTVRMTLAGGFALEASAPGAALAPGTRRTVCLRPEAVRVLAPDAAAGPNRRPGRVGAAVFRGEDILYEIGLDGGPTLHALAANPRGRGLFARGDAVVATWDAADLLILPGP